MSKSWWQEIEDMIDGVDIGSAPVSQIWRRKVGYHDPFDRTASSTEKQRLERALNMLSRTANVVKNSKREEKQLFIKFGDGKEINVPLNNTVILSPDFLLEQPAEKDELTLDGLTGKVLTIAAMKRTMHGRSWLLGASGRSSHTDTIAKPIWQAIETAVARQDVLTDWMGFAPYFKRHQEQVGASRDYVEAHLARETPGAEQAALLLCWNMLNPNSRITPPAPYVNAMDDAEDLMRAPMLPENRYDRACNAAELLLKHFPPPFSGVSDATKAAMFLAKSLTDPEVFGAPIRCSDENKAHLPPSKEVTDDEEEIQGKPEIPDGCIQLTHPTVVTRYEQRDGRAYRNAVNRLRPYIGQVRNTMRFRNEVHYANHGLLSGDLDSGSLHKLSYQRNNPAVWERKLVRAVSHATIGLLLDESGSMGDCGDDDKRKIDKARDVLITMVEGLRHAQGIQLMVLGHSAESHLGAEHSHGTLTVHHRPPNKHPAQLWMTEYISPNTKTPFGLMHTRARCQNLDGFAMEYSIRRLATDYDSPIKVLFVISDGMPHGTGYGGGPAYRHMNNVCQFGQRLGVHTYGIGIANAYTLETGEQMYGKGRCVILNDVMSSIGILTGFIKPIAQKLI